MILINLAMWRHDRGRFHAVRTSWFVYVTVVPVQGLGYVLYGSLVYLGACRILCGLSTRNLCVTCYHHDVNFVLSTIPDYYSEKCTDSYSTIVPFSSYSVVKTQFAR